MFLILSISNTSLSFLKEVKRACNSGYIVKHKDKRKNRKPLYELYVKYNGLRDILKGVAPFIIVKSKQVELLLEALDILKENKHIKWDEEKIRNNYRRLEDIYLELKKLNKRGR